ncbi:60S ribosomal protein L18 (Fragment) [Durusdinium trenchii]|uniref:60S ribosomal protein L18 n=1 Tax=Durusdinium trenchii TaxID=1381693 RepID=A0ABP0RN29_9DINO
MESLGLQLSQEQLEAGEEELEGDDQRGRLAAEGLRGALDRTQTDYPDFVAVCNTCGMGGFSDWTPAVLFVWQMEGSSSQAPDAVGPARTLLTSPSKARRAGTRDAGATAYSKYVSEEVLGSCEGTTYPMYMAHAHDQEKIVTEDEKKALEGALNHRRLQIWVLRAELLRSFESFGKMDPFVVVEHVTSSRKWPCVGVRTHEDRINLQTLSCPVLRELALLEEVPYLYCTKVIRFRLLEKNFGDLGKPTFCVGHREDLANVGSRECLKMCGEASVPVRVLLRSDVRCPRVRRLDGLTHESMGPNGEALRSALRTDIEAGGRKKVKKREVKSQLLGNPYLRLLCQLYKFLARRSESKFNKVIAKRLNMSGRNRPPLSLSKLIKHMDGKDGKVAVVVGTVTDDKRVYDVPEIKVCALRFTETARARIVKAGGECLTFDTLAMRPAAQEGGSPLGKGTVLLRGPVKSREAERHFGKAPGVPNSKTAPYVRSKGRKCLGAGRAAGRALFFKRWTERGRAMTLLFLGTLSVLFARLGELDTA